MTAEGPAGTRNESELRQAMADEATRIEGWARTWDYTYRQRARSWSRFNTALVVVSALLAAVAGATALGKVWSSSVGPGFVALAAAAASGVAGALGASKRATDYNSAAASNSGLADAARVFRTTVAFDREIAVVTRQFDALSQRRDAVVAAAPISGPPKKVGRQYLDAQPPNA